MKTLTKGNVIVEEIRIGDIHYEYEYGVGIKSTVISLPEWSDKGYWHWQSETKSGVLIDYVVNPKYPHYSVNLYDYEAYSVRKNIS